MELVLDQFAFVTNVDKAGVRLLPSLQHNEQLEEHASMVVERMENGFLPHDYDIYSDVTDARLDWPFGRSIDNLARSILYTGHGRGCRDLCEEVNYVDMYHTWYAVPRSTECSFTKMEDFISRSPYTKSLKRRRLREMEMACLKKTVEAVTVSDDGMLGLDEEVPGSESTERL